MFTKEDYANAREKYRPINIRILFVAESPPSSGGYFYFPRTIGKDHLFRETMKALELWPTTAPMGKNIDKRPLLERFRSRGFFLIDTCELPVDKLLPHERNKVISSEAPGLAHRVRQLDPDHVIVVKKTVHAYVCDSLGRAGLLAKVLNRQPIPFPSHGNQKLYRTRIRRLINKN